MSPWWLLFGVCFLRVTWWLTIGRHALSHGFSSNLMWAFDWTEQVRRGVLYPRWMEQSFAGLGAPAFHFYGPLSMYAVLPFSLGLRLPTSTSVLCSFWLAMLILSVGMGRLVTALEPRRPRWLPPVIAAITVLSPYLLCDVYVRGALAETWAMAVFPWLLLALCRSLERPTRARRLALVAASAAYALCHPPLLLIGLGCIAGALLLTLRSRTDVVRVLRDGVAPVGAGLILDAFYLFPAVRDQVYVHIEALDKEGHAFNRLMVTELSRGSPKLALGFDGTMVPFFLVGVLVFLLAVWSFRRRGGELEPRASERLLILLGAAAIALFMQTDLARGLYTMLPVLNRIQFAYRWMAIVTVATLALLGFVIVSVGPRTDPGAGGPWRLAIGLLAVWISTQAFEHALPMADWNKAYSDRLDGMLERLRTSGEPPDTADGPLKDCRGVICVNARDELVAIDVPEYRPRTQPEAGFPPRTFGRVEWAEGSGVIEVQAWRPGHRQLTARSPSGGKILLRTHAWLGWQVEVNGTRRVGTRAGDWGRMLVEVPAGHSEVRVTYRGTPSQRTGNWVSLVCLGLLAAYAGWDRRRQGSSHSPAGGRRSPPISIGLGPAIPQPQPPPSSGACA